MASRRSDLKLIAAATVAVLLAGGFIAGAIWVATSGTSSAQCPELPAGVVSDVRRELRTSPAFRTGGGRCSFWLALLDNDVVAFKAEQPTGCTLKYQRDHWECGGETVDEYGLATYPVTIRAIGTDDTLIVDLRPPAAGTPAS